MPNNPSIRKNAVYSTAYQVIRLVFPIITYPYVARVIGPSGIGLVSYTQSISDYFLHIALLGLPLYGAREIAKNRLDPIELKKNFSELVTISTGFTFLAGFLFLTFPLLFPKLSVHPLLHLFFGISILSSSGRLDWFYRGIEDFKYISIRNFAIRLLSIVLIFLIIKSPEDFILYGAIWAGGTVIANTVNISYSLKKVGFTLKELDLRRHLPLLFASAGIVLITTIYNGIDTVMLRFLVDDGGESLGFYALSGRLTRVIRTIIIAGVSVVTPRIALLHSSGEEDKLKSLISKNVKYALLFALPMSAGLILIANDAVLLFGGRDFIDATLTLQFLSLQLIFVTLGNITSQQMLYSLNRERPMFISFLISLTTAILLNFIFIPLYQHTGAAIATVLANMVQVLVQVYFAKRLFWDSIKGKETLKIITATIGYVLVLLTFNRAFLIEYILVRVALNIFIGGVVYGLILYLMRSALLIETVNKLILRRR